MRRLVWALQIVLGVYFVLVGITHFVVPEGLPAQMAWMYDLPTWTHVVAGIAEVAGGLGLVLPQLTGIRRELVPLAGAGLTIVMLSAAIYHAGRSEYQNIVFNLVLAGMLVVVTAVRRQADHAGTAAAAH